MFYAIGVTCVIVVVILMAQSLWIDKQVNDDDEGDTLDKFIREW